MNKNFRVEIPILKVNNAIQKNHDHVDFFGISRQFGLTVIDSEVANTQVQIKVTNLHLLINSYESNLI